MVRLNLISPAFVNRVDADHLASYLDLHCLLRHGMSCSAREGLTSSVLLLNTTCHVLTNSVDPDKKPTDLGLHCLSLNI